MLNDKAKSKDEFKGRIHKFVLDAIGFVAWLPEEQTSRIITHQLLESTTSTVANAIEARAAFLRQGLQQSVYSRPQVSRRM